MDGSSGTYGGEQKSEQGPFVGNIRERDYLKDVCVDWSIILKLVLRK
jgi:hypothetical protein